MDEFYITCCDYDEILDNICFKIKIDEKLSDLKNKFENIMEFKNLFFYSKKILK